MPLTKITNTGVTGLTIDSSGRVLTSSRPSFQYDITNYSSGTNYLSAPYDFGEQNDNEIDTAYMSPIPFINAITTDGFTTNVGSGASFVDHPVSSNYKYLKFTAPIAGLYCFGMVVHFVNYYGANDYMGFGLAKNRVTNTGSASDGTTDFDKSFVNAGVPDSAGGALSGSTIMSLALNDYVVWHMRSVQELRFNQTGMNFFGYLIG
tara:strand:- start:291 stop:908 length:618 start_codon:yes stop_codon:yes gene_type:complete